MWMALPRNIKTQILAVMHHSRRFGLGNEHIAKRR